MLSVGLLVTAVAGLLVTAVAADAQLPREVTLATNPPGTSYYAVASGLAKVVSGAAGFQMVVQPYTGTSTMLPLLNTGEVDFGLVNAVDMGLSYRGPDFKIGGRNPFPHAPNLRLVMRGSPLLVGLLVRKDSPIRSVHDVKGKRMTGEYPAHLAVWYNMLGHLSSAGLAWQDVRVVPVPAVEPALKARWDNESQLGPIHPMLREWTRDRAVGPDVTIPYHPAAVRFYKERGVWRPELDQLQQKLLSVAP